MRVEDGVADGCGDGETEAVVTGPIDELVGEVFLIEEEGDDAVNEGGDEGPE